MRISDWSSDVCSSDLISPGRSAAGAAARRPGPPAGPRSATGASDVARIPRYGGPQVQATNLPNVRLSDNMPAPDTSGLQAVAGVFGKIAQAEPDKANTAAQMELENQLAGPANSTLYDADSGCLHRHAKEATGVPEKTTTPSDS